LFRAATLVLFSLSLEGDERLCPMAVAVQETNRDGILQDEFFSGSIQEVSETSVTVSRSLPGKSPETRSFVVDSDTIIEGKLKKLARVTVGYRTHDGQDHAWRIIVRDSPE
jgi:hypothetical protein